ncbi:MAG TPA: IPT/TIG domain-containing protein [Acidobacteriota bacterium]
MNKSSWTCLGPTVTTLLLGIFLHSQVKPHVATLRATGAAAQIIIDPANPSATEVTVNEGNTLQLKPRVIDGSGNVIDSAPLTYKSLSEDVASIDASGNIQGNKAGFSTLAVTSGAVVATTTVTVVAISSGVSGFEITGVAQDLARRLYLADTRDDTILLADELQKTPSIYAGVSQQQGLINGDRVKSLFKNPAFLAFNQAQGSLYVSDSANNVIRQVRPGPNGQVETLAGTGQAGSADGPLDQASFNNPQGVALDNRGYQWVVDSGNHTIRRIDLVNRMVQTVAGKAGTAGSADGRGTTALFNSPVGIAVETESLAQELERNRTGAPPPLVSVIIADTGNGLIRRVREDGQVETLSVAGQSKTASAPRWGVSRFDAIPNETPHRNVSSALTFSSPTGVAVDQFGNIYVSETNAGQVKTILQKGNVVPLAQGNTFFGPRGITVTQSGKVVIAESNRSGREITYGEPQIGSITPDRTSNRGGAKVTVKGKNFSADTLLIAAGVVIPGIEIKDTQTISFTAPPLPSGRTTVTVQNRGGLAQGSLVVDPVPLSDLPPGQITTIAGGTTFIGDGTAATSATFSFPQDIAVDMLGNFFIADSFNHRIRKVGVGTGVIITVAGTGVFGFSGDNGPATAATLNDPSGLAFDAAGNLFIVDQVNARVRKVDIKTGSITTAAGNGIFGFSGDNGPAVLASLSLPGRIAIDLSGNLYIVDRGNGRIRKVDIRTGIITTVAGNGQFGFSGDNGPAIAATFSLPEGIAIDSAGNLFIADTLSHRIRKVDANSGIITTVAGSGTAGFSGEGGPAVGAALNSPSGLAIDLQGNLLIADKSNNRIRKLDAQSGRIVTVAGSGVQGFSGDNGPASAAALAVPSGIALDAGGNLFIADSANGRMRKVDPATGLITTVAGKDVFSISGDNGPATAAALSSPTGIVFDSANNLLIADTGFNAIRKVDAGNGVISTLSGGNTFGFSGDGGPAINARLGIPYGIAVDGRGNLFITDSFNNRIRKIASSTGIITTVAGNGLPNFSGDNGPAVASGLSGPSALAFDTAGNLFVADTGNSRIRRIDAATEIISTVAGSGQPGFSGDNGPATAASLNLPYGIAVDTAGNIFIADSFNNRIRKVDAGSGIITTVAGNGTAGFSGDGGFATIASLSSPYGIAIDKAGNLFIADSGNHRLRKVIAGTGIVITVAGNGAGGGLGSFSGDNSPATGASLNFPHGLALDAAGNLFLADRFNNRIRAVRGSTPTRRRP